MGYRKMTKEDVYQIIRRWHHGQKITRISKTEGCSRKTIRKYVNKLLKAGINRGKSLPGKEELFKILESVLPVNERKKEVTSRLIQHEEELKELINDPKEPVKMKTAFEIIKCKYDLKVSYETFKIFARNKKLSKSSPKKIIRIELPPGIETQLDYGKVGFLQSSTTGKNKVVWAFCGILANSRLPFIQYVYTQKQESFCESIIDTFEFYEGVTEIVSIDNLKAGVIKPDLWDPKINKSLQEVAEYYGVFIDPCRVGKSQDKGKIERLVPSARELFRKLKKLYPTAGLNELNKHALKWCREEYGEREHGTTKVPPISAYKIEKNFLKSLPAERFEAPVWKKAHVHRFDGFFTFEKKRYSLPAKYKDKDVWVRYTERDRLLKIFYNDILIRQYMVTSKVMNYFPEDFPEVKREMMNGGYPKYLLNQAGKFGNSAYKFVKSILEPHAYLNMRRAQGVLKVMKEFCSKPYFDEICLKAIRRNVKLPSTFKNMLLAEENQHTLDFGIDISGLGKKMTRDITYYIS